MCHVHADRAAAERCGVLLGGAPELVRLEEVRPGVYRVRGLFAGGSKTAPHRPATSARATRCSIRQFRAGRGGATAGPAATARTRSHGRQSGLVLGGGRCVCHGAPATSAPVDHASPHRLGADGATTPAQSRLVFARCDGAVGGRSRWRATVEAAALEGDRSDASLQRSSGGADASRHPRPIRGESGAQRRPQRGQGRTGVATPRRPGRFARRQRRGYPCWGMFGARGGCSLSVHVAAAAAALGVIVSAQEAPRTPWGDPDLQGIWVGSTLTPLERPSEYRGGSS